MLYNRIIETLTQNNIPFTEHRHEPVRTSEEAAKVRGSDINEGAKALIFWAFKVDGSKSPIQLVLQGSKRVDKEKFLKQNPEFIKIKMVSAEEVLAIAGVEPGGVPPFATLFSYKDDPRLQDHPYTISRVDPREGRFSPEAGSVAVYADCGLLKLENIEFNAGDKSISIRMKTKDWAKIVNPIEIDLIEKALNEEKNTN